MTRRMLAAFGLALILFAGSPIEVGAQDEVPAQCRTIIGCADAGPKPENPGDRGGYAQLLTLAVLVGGVGFIMSRVVKATRASQPDPTE